MAPRSPDRDGPLVRAGRAPRRGDRSRAGCTWPGARLAAAGRIAAGQARALAVFRTWADPAGGAPDTPAALTRRHPGTATEGPAGPDGMPADLAVARADQSPFRSPRAASC